MPSKKNSPSFQPVPSRPHFGELTEEILQFWKKNQIFQKSMDLRPQDNPYVFYDGPPFVTGLPHYGHLLSSIAKDLIPRFWTMKGKRVNRVWGWDCHGLPIENKVEQKLQLNSRRDIEKVGLETFIKECYSYVSDISSEWSWYIDHIGRWVDMEHAYKTMDNHYMESVWWVFKQIYDKKLIYQGKRVSLYCPRCGTPISNFEVAMDNSYKEVTEPANTYKYKIRNPKSEIRNKFKITEEVLKNDDPVFILAWSTTPWNKLATPALAVNPGLTYVLVQQGTAYYILAKTTLSIINDEPFTVIAEFEGSCLEGLHFEPHYDFYEIPEGKEAWVIVGGDFVTADEGTGVVTLAIYGEDDFKILQEKQVVLLEHVDEEGTIRIPSTSLQAVPFNGLYYLKANKLVNQDLTQRGLMYREDHYTHSVPVCWRCATRLMFAPQEAWFIAVQKLKKQLLTTNEAICWFPQHLKHGRFQKGIESAPDWCISRSRYWATPMPVWACQGRTQTVASKTQTQPANPDDQSSSQSPPTADGCGNIKVVGSMAELEQLTGKKVQDLHRPYIDAFTFTCNACGGTMQRIPDVLDSWIDAGSMPYAERHYPFEHKAAFEASFPADYIVEYVAQTRAWFYVLHVLSNALFATHSFKHVICHGVIQGTDGRKMSKSYGNYPDPKRVLEEHGGDAFRLYLMSSPIMAAETINVSEEEIKEQNQRVLTILWNSYKYFVTYANLFDFKPSVSQAYTSGHILDQWILLRLTELGQETDRYLQAYNIPKAVRLIRPFVSDLSNWYIRRSRDRFATGDAEALQTLYQVLFLLSQILAPTIPFMAEKIYQGLTIGARLQFPSSNVKESVHLCDWPNLAYQRANQTEFLQHMHLTREICSLGNEVRKQRQLPTRQVLAKVTVRSASPPPGQTFLDILADELNVKKIMWQRTTTATEIDFDTQLTPILRAEGEARVLIRRIQEARRTAEIDRSATITVTAPSWPTAFEAEIKARTLATELQKGTNFEIHLAK